MFRVKQSEVSVGFALATRLLLVALLVAILVAVGLVWFISAEQRLVASSEGEPLVRSAEVSAGLPRFLRWQLALSLLVLLILIATAAALVVIRRAFLASRQSLREVKVLAHDILASMDQGVVTTNCDGIVTSINPRGCDLLGIDFECVGRPLAAISRPEILLDALSREVLGRHRPLSDRDFALSQNGHIRRLRADCHLLNEPDGEVLGTVLHIREVTERVLIEERMRRMERHMGLGSLAVGLHHEIKNPLAALSLHVQLLEERLAEKPPDREVDELVGVLKTEVTRLNGVLETFRDFASMRTLSLQTTDVAELVEKAVRLVRPQAESQNVRIHVAPADPPPAMSLDPAKFEQVLLNLIINALEAMPSGGDLTICASAPGGQLQVEVADTGCGIPVEVQPRIFDPYFTTKADGAGMGLAWSEKIVEQHQGHIEFQTGPRGTVFKVRVPLAAHTEA